jgi:hypothetical protein
VVSPIRGLTAAAVTIGLTAAVLDSSTPVLARQQSSNNRPEARAFAYSYAREAALAAKFDMDNPDPGELRRTFDERRARVLAAIPRGDGIRCPARSRKPGAEPRKRCTSIASACCTMPTAWPVFAEPCRSRAKVSLKACAP